MIYDSADASNLTRPIYHIDKVEEVIFANLPVVYGILVVPGTGQAVSVSYS
jgi:hypothetical protein